MNKFFFVIITIAAAFIFEISFGRFITIFEVSLPLVICLIVFWYWRTLLPARFSMAAFFGLALESISLQPFGIYFLILVSLAFITDFLKFFFSNTKSYLTQAVAAALSIFFVLIFLFLSNFFFGAAAGSINLDISHSFLMLAGALIWSLLLPISIFSVQFISLRMLK